MNSTIKAIKQGEHVEITELFELVNSYKITMLSLNAPDGTTILTLAVNQFEKIVDNRYQFSQARTTSNYTVNADEFTIVDATYIPEQDAVSIICPLKNGCKLYLYVFKINQYQDEITVDEDYREIDYEEFDDEIEDLVLAHDENEFFCLNVKITDLYGIDMHTNTIMVKELYEILSPGPDKIIIYPCEEDCLTYITIPVEDGTVIYKKEISESSVRYVIKPFGMPFTDVSLEISK